MFFQRQFEINERSPIQDSQNLPVTPTAVCAQLSLNYLKSTETKDEYQSVTGLSLEWEGSKSQRNKRTHTNVKITILRYNEPLIWLSTSKAKMVLLFFFWACLFFRNDKIQISKESVFYWIVRWEWRKRILLRKLLSPQCFACKEQQLSVFKLNFHWKKRERERTSHKDI